MQLSSIECGAACLAMILGYYGRKTRVSECRMLLNVGRNGVTAQALTREARRFGLQVGAFSLETAAFTRVPLPAIVHWNFEHFIVVERWSHNRVDVVDPAVGRRRLTNEQFDAGFTGVVLTFKPGPTFDRQPAQDHPSWLRHFLTIIVRERPGVLGQILGASLLLQALGLAGPLTTQVMIDRVLPAHNLALLEVFGIGMAILLFVQVIMRYLRSVLLLYLETRLDTTLMMNFFEHLLSLPFTFFQHRSSGDLLLRLSSNEKVRDLLSDQAFSIILDSVLVLTYFGILMVQAKLLAGLALAFGLGQAFLALLTADYRRSLTKEILATEAEEHSYLVEMLKGISTLKVSGTEQRAFDTWAGLFFKTQNTAIRKKYSSILIDSGTGLLRAFAPFVFFWLGIHQVMTNAMSLGEALALNSLAIAFLSPLSSLVSSFQQLQTIGARLDRIADVLEATPEYGIRDGLVSPKLTGAIEIDRVSFRYDADAPLVLQEVSISIKAGQKIAIVGRSGSGKSTLASLLLGLYQPTSGQVLYDGVDLQRINYRTLRRQIGVVLQDPFLFSRSIRQNIVLCAPNISIASITEVAKMTAIHDDIMAMPMGYETRVAEGGSALSGGQRQRLVLARALAMRPSILLLDEASSHLDSVTEQQIEQNLDALKCTRIVIAHRLSTVRNADLIVVLDQGKIVESGTHAELLQRGGHYTNLVNRQQNPSPA
jgi:HlyB family type I secretion system ABC transporter